jgi:CrcB protein
LDRDRRELAAIFVGGSAGAVLRTLLEDWFPVAKGGFPWTTFAINVAGCLLLGYFVTRLQERLPITAYRRPLLATGFCGGLTTFSTAQLELLKLLDDGSIIVSATYAAGGVLAGFLGVLIGTAAVRRARLTW